MGYYFISVGGSGARVLEALAHLCVAGLLPNEEKQENLYAMSIDPDTANGNLTRTHQLLKSIEGFQAVNVGKGTPILKTPLTLANPFDWSPTQLGKNLDDVIGYETYKDKAVGKLYEALYTKKERRTVLDEGFRGRPSIGAAVMAKKALTDEKSIIEKDPAWQNFISAVQHDVGIHGSAQIFLAGSVFGGTGAAGLPTIARLLRKIFENNCKKGEVRIGSVLLLPYFSFAPTEEQKEKSGLFASSNNFLTNSKAALRYYDETGGSDYDDMYFIGDDTMVSVPNFSIGAGTQCNDAHIIDLFAAMAAVHFYYGHTGQNSYRISRSQDNAFCWSDLPDVQMKDGSTVSVRERLVQFTRFIFAYLHLVKPVLQDLEDGRKKANGYPWYKDFFQGNIKASAAEVQSFDKYAKSFVMWLNQVEHSAGARTVELIRPDSFSIQNNHIKINSSLFKTLDYGNSIVDIDTVNTRLADNGGRWYDRVLGRKKNTNQDVGQGFGRFLRKLYDSCVNQ